MKIYELLLNNRRPHLVMPSREYVYFQENESLLTYVPEIIPFVNSKDEFSLILANIVLESIKNYLAIENYFKEKPLDPLPSIIKPLFTYNSVAIYCPLFSISNNLLLANDHGAKLTLTNDSIDLFETYNFALFESNLTSLVHVGCDEHTSAYYHYDFHTIYIINDQGRIDVRIALFDRHLANPDFRNILERIKPVLAAYYAGDKRAFLYALAKEKLISPKLYNRYNADRKKHD